MAQFNYTSNFTGQDYLTIEISTVGGTIFCCLNGTSLSQVEIDAITAGMLDIGKTQNEIDAYILELETMNNIHNQIIQVANSGNMDDLIDSIGNNPSGWFYPFCNKYNINTNPNPVI